MQASASQDKNRRKPGHNEGTHHPDYENITLAFRNKEELKLHQSAPKKQAQVRPLSDTPQIPPWLHRTIMILYILLALIFSFCIILSTLVLVKNSEMSRELWSLRAELLNVSSLVLQCQDQQNNHWKAVQTGIQEAKSNIATVSSKVQSGNDKLKTVSADITDIKKTLQELEKKALARKPGLGRCIGVEFQT
ncbi:mast cell-expressed membrane protein 1 [Arvicola amphibius]|uniref:mast cell-expressed membrane protein 1 n=1 Tax=Arvicola amphibius TaxID=1047088 RepID=UPI0018E3AE63|nr:mast cell-expressed membrane protein 1 [Arvicola amphibius]